MPGNKTDNYGFDLVADADTLKTAMKTKPDANWTALDSELKSMSDSIPSDYMQRNDITIAPDSAIDALFDSNA